MSSEGQGQSSKNLCLVETMIKQHVIVHMWVCTKLLRV